MSKTFDRLAFSEQPMSKPLGGNLSSIQTCSFQKGATVELPAQLKKHREQMDLSQEDVANNIFVSRQTISNWETGKTYPDVQSLLLLSNLFDVSVDELLKGDVKVMQKDISRDARTFKHLAWAMSAFMVAAIVSCCLAIILRDIGDATSYGMSLASLLALGAAAVLFLCAFAAAVWAEVLKKQNNVITYKEIVAFVQGKSPEEVRDDGSFARKHPIASVVSKVCFGAIAALVFVVLFNIIAKTIRDIIFMNMI